MKRSRQPWRWQKRRLTLTNTHKASLLHKESWVNQGTWVEPRVKSPDHATQDRFCGLFLFKKLCYNSYHIWKTY